MDPMNSLTQNNVPAGMVYSTGADWYYMTAASHAPSRAYPTQGAAVEAMNAELAEAGR